MARVSLDHDSAMINRRGGYISRGSLCEDAAAVAVPVHPALVSWIVRLHD